MFLIYRCYIKIPKDISEANCRLNLKIDWHLIYKLSLDIKFQFENLNQK